MQKCKKCNLYKEVKSTHKVVAKNGKTYFYYMCDDCHQNDGARKLVAVRVARWREKNPLRAIAQRKVFVEIRSGRMEKQVCCICGCDDTQAHHPDYSKPLDVVWLCKKHHSEMHRK